MHNVTDRNFATTAEAAQSQKDAAQRPETAEEKQARWAAEGSVELSPGAEALLAHGIGEYPSKAEITDDRRFSQAPPTRETVSALLGSIEIIEALGTVLDLSFLVDDVSEDEAAARNFISSIVASAARVIKSNLDQEG